MKQLTATLMLCVLAIAGLHAQITTSSITGTVKDASGETLPGATILAVHVPSGTSYGVVTRDDGGYSLPNLRVGGPYKVEASFTGYQAYVVENLYLKLGERKNLDMVLQQGVELNVVDVIGQRNSTINSDRTGAATYVTLEQLQTLPTITRSTADLTRLNPMAAEGGSFGGRNDQFNNYSLDGSIFNNPFGLDAATPGGQADAQPVSLDAIEAISVSIAPFDVTQAGFTGASIDAVTKSGTNQFHGSVFGYYRNKDMIGVKVDDTEVRRGDLSQLQSGFSIGGPIVPNKIFFFANFELERRSDLGSYFDAARPGSSGANISRVQAADLELVSNALFNRFGYETGAYEGYKHDTDNQKGLFKLDFNLSDAHKLTTTFNFLDAFRQKPAHPSAIGRRGPDNITLQFQNSGYQINNKLYSGIVELKSIFGNQFANKLQVGATAFRDTRDPFSTPFPVVSIQEAGQRYIVAGHEPFSINNRLNQDVFQITDNFNIYLPGHTLTIGTSFEKFSFDNSFNLNAYGGTFGDYPSLDAFLVHVDTGGLDADVAAAQTTFDTNNKENTWALAETNLGQWAFYAQDEIAVTDNLNVTLGLRVDVPLYFDTKEKIEENLARNCCYDPSIEYFDEDGNSVFFDHTVLPEQKPLFSPRLGFNLDITGDQTSQLRGGTGLFTGRFPFVWVGNQVANPNFFFYTITNPDFQFPQVWRTNLGFDQKFGQGWTATIDAIYTKDRNAMMVRNYGLKLPGGTLQGPGSRPIYRLEDRALVFGGPTNAYVFTNTDVGRTVNIAVQLQKQFESGLRFSIAYNYLDAKDAASIDAEISSDAYDRNPANVQRTNTAELAPSLYGNKHRVVGSLYKKFTYAGSWATHVAVFMEYVQGNRYSYTYSGDINNDGSPLNDLIYIPTDAEVDQMNFGGDAAAQKAALKKYIGQDDYLSGRRGEFAEKYGNVSPWYSRWDMRIMQEYGLSNGNSVQLSLDILNFANLISNKWGVREVATFTGLAQPIGVSVDAQGMPTYSFETSQTSTFTNDFGLNSRWQAQLGLRYNF